MTANSDLIVSYPGFFVSEFREEALWLRFSGNFFHNFLIFDRRDFLHDFFERLSANREIKTVVIHSAFHESGSDEYLRFFLFECPERDLGHFGFSNTLDRYDLHRYCSMIDRTVMDLVTLNKMVIHICCGDILSLFMNISLACDYRIVADDTVFHNIFHQIGMLPKGGGPFFLSQAIGPSRAKGLLLQHQITAKEALDNNIADLSVPRKNLEATALDFVRRFSEIPDSTLFGLKRLANYSLRELENYLEFETQEIIKIGHRKDFSDQ